MVQFMDTINCHGGSGGGLCVCGVWRGGGGEGVLFQAHRNVTCAGKGTVMMTLLAMLCDQGTEYNDSLPTIFFFCYLASYHVAAKTMNLVYFFSSQLAVSEALAKF